MNPNANSFQGFRPPTNTFPSAPVPPPSSSSDHHPRPFAQPAEAVYPHYPGHGDPNYGHPNLPNQPSHHPYAFQQPFAPQSNYPPHQLFHQPCPPALYAPQPHQAYPQPSPYASLAAHSQRQHHQHQAPESWEEESTPARPPPSQPVTPVLGYQNGARTVSLSSATRSRTTPPNDKPAVVSISIGKKKSPNPPCPSTTKPAAELKSSPVAGRLQPATCTAKKPTRTTPSPPPPNAKSPGTLAEAGAAPRQQPPTDASASAPAGNAAPLAPGGKTIAIGEARRPIKDADAIKSEVEAAVDEDTLKDLYESKKEAEIKEEGKTHVNVVFIGHVDAGKSTMGGNILYLTGMVDKRTMEKLEKEAKDAGKESWYLSWALDSTVQERAQGKTVEIGRAYFETDLRRYTILDAPGHKTYVPAMISGASQADIAILVISARRGEFETGFERGGQTREHAMLVKTTGVTKLMVVINKMDDITVGWDQSRYDEIINKLTPFLKLTGFNPSKDITFIPVSGYTGGNIKDRVAKDKCPWYDGPSLLELLDHTQLLDRKYHAPLMMPVSEKYKDMGTVVVGKLESGKVSKGESVLMMPNKSTVEVSAIYNEMEDEVPRALCGDNVRIRLKGIEDEDVMCGFVLTDSRKPIRTVSKFEAQLAILDSKNIICAGYGAVIHVHTLAEECTLIGLLHYYDKKTGKKSRRPPQFAKKGMKVVAVLETSNPVCVETFKDYPQLGRFTLRDEGKTIAIGKITKLIEAQDDISSTMAKLDVSANAMSSSAAAAGSAPAA